MLVFKGGGLDVIENPVSPYCTQEKKKNLPTSELASEMAVQKINVNTWKIAPCCYWNNFYTQIANSEYDENKSLHGRVWFL